ncbi:MAG: hypothetical protein JKY37_34260 [Nannocystaceae bacterium]|nr:hypothetical protein [Nannocystaceae bacterium]
MTDPTCGCNRGHRPHGNTGKCRLCWSETLEPDSFPDVPMDPASDPRVSPGALVFSEHVTMGTGVRVHGMASVGSRPFEFVRDEQGVLQGFPRCGDVVLGDNVEIFPYANVDAGFLGTTEIRQGTKIDHYVHVGHNSLIGERVVICAGAIVGGHVEIGDDAFVGINVSLKPRITIGEGAVIGSAANVLSNVPAKEVWVGNPAKRIR